MINITDVNQYPVEVLDSIAKVAVLSTVGVSANRNGSIVHLLDEATIGEQNKAQEVLSNFDSLTVTADKTTMTEGDADPVISCSDTAIGSDSDVNYLVLLDGDNFADGSTPVTAGEATLNLISPIAGVYEIFIYRTTGNFASGSVTITVNEV